MTAPLCGAFNWVLYHNLREILFQDAMLGIYPFLSLFSVFLIALT